MSPTDAIIGSVIVISGSSMIKNAKEGHPHMSTLVSGFLLGSALMLVAMVSPAIAKALAAMGAIGAVLANGPEVFGIVGKLGA